MSPLPYDLNREFPKRSSAELTFLFMELEKAHYVCYAKRATQVNGVDYP